MAMNGKINRISNGHISYDIYKAPAVFLVNIADFLTKRFDLTLVSPKPIVGPDGSYLEFRKGNIRITAGWDIWSGCFIQAYCSGGDELVGDIGSYLDTLSFSFEYD
jgi:hypothetical protein